MLSYLIICIESPFLKKCFRYDYVSVSDFTPTDLIKKIFNIESSFLANPLQRFSDLPELFLSPKLILAIEIFGFNEFPVLTENMAGPEPSGESENLCT